MRSDTACADSDYLLSDGTAQTSARRYDEQSSATG